MTLAAPIDAVIIGGGPAGSTAARLLAAWGHSVVILDNPAPRTRGLAESIPPSTRKLLSEVGVLADVERAAFYRSTGNTVWWAADEPRLEAFSATGGSRETLGYQVFRPDFDRLLIESAGTAGAEVRTPARVRSVSFANGGATVDYEQGGCGTTIASRLVLDCSGRAGILGRRFRRAQPGYRTFAVVGVWDSPSWDLPDHTHTLVETCEHGWAWSVPVSPTTRHVGVMVGHGQSYQSALAMTARLRRTLAAATLQREWTCDASLYRADQNAGEQFLLVGDAGSFIDPLSSFGVKKALASAWLAAIVAHTTLVHPERASVARDFFSNWERDVYTTHLRRSRDFARAAYQAHASAFWSSRAETAIPAIAAPDAADDRVAAETPAFDVAADFDLVLAAGVRFEPHPVIRGHEIALEEAFAGGVRFAGHVDLVTLAKIACHHRHVRDLMDAYCRQCPPVPLPNLVGGLSMLVAKGILHARA